MYIVIKNAMIIFLQIWYNPKRCIVFYASTCNVNDNVAAE